METISRKDLNLAWLAGLIDGDGCISMRIQKQRSSRASQTEYPVPYMQLTTTCETTKQYLDKLFRTLEVGVHIRLRPNGKDHKPVWIFTINGLERNRRFLPLVHPHFVTKQRESELVQEFIAIRQRLFAQKKRDPREFAILAELKRIKQERNFVRNPQRLYARLQDGEDIVRTAWRHVD